MWNYFDLFECEHLFDLGISGPLNKSLAVTIRAQSVIGKFAEPHAHCRTVDWIVFIFFSNELWPINKSFEPRYEPLPTCAEYRLLSIEFWISTAQSQLLSLPSILNRLVSTNDTRPLILNCRFSTDRKVNKLNCTYKKRSLTIVPSAKLKPPPTNRITPHGIRWVILRQLIRYWMCSPDFESLVNCLKFEGVMNMMNKMKSAGVASPIC